MRQLFHLTNNFNYPLGEGRSILGASLILRIVFLFINISYIKFGGTILFFNDIFNYPLGEGPLQGQSLRLMIVIGAPNIRGDYSLAIRIHFLC